MKAKTAIFIAVVLLAAAFFVTRIGALRADIGDIDLQVDWMATALSLGLLLAGFCAMAVIWWLALRGVGEQHSPAQAFSSFALTQFSKYLPGGIWPILGRAALLSGSKPRLLAASVMEAGIKVIAALALSMLLIDTSNQVPAWAAAVVVFVVLVLVRPQVLRPLLGALGRVSERFELDLSSFSQPHISLAVVLSAGTWVLVGVAYAVFINGFVDAPFTALVGAFALAWAVGFLVIPAPAGIGVREVVLVVATTPFLTEPMALVLALAARLWWMAGDALLFALGLATRKSAFPEDP